MAYYHECPYCGGTLDPGERCDCEKEDAPKLPETPSKRNPLTLYPESIKKSSPKDY